MGKSLVGLTIPERERLADMRFLSGPLSPEDIVLLEKQSAERGMIVAQLRASFDRRFEREAEAEELTLP